MTPREFFSRNAAADRRRSKSRLKAAIRAEQYSAGFVSLPLMFLAGFLFEGFFLYDDNPWAARVLNLTTLAFVGCWAAWGFCRRALPGGSTLLMAGNLLLLFGALRGLVLGQSADYQLLFIAMKTLGTLAILFALDRLERRRFVATLNNTEEYLESVFESIPDPVLVIGAGRRIVAGNRAAIVVFGDSVIGRTCCEAVLGHRDCTSCTVTEVWDKRKARHEIVRDENGRRRYEVTTFPLMGRSGFSGHLFQQIRDVSHQARAEDQASLLENVVNSVRDPVITLSLDGKLVHRNPAAEGLIGVDPVGAPPRDVSELMLFVRIEDRDDLVRVVRSAQLWEREARLLAHDRKERSVVLSVAPVRSADDRLLGTVLVVRDVTEVKRLQSQLMQTEKLGALGHLVSGVAHELNNPLTAVFGFAQLLLSSKIDPELEEQIDYICTNAQRCKHIIDGLLTFARQHRIEKVSYNLNDVVRSAVSLLQYQLRIANIELVTRLDADLPYTSLDVFQMQQVMVNLLTNAQHAIQERGVPGRIEIETTLVDEETLQLIFTDNGCGMSDSVISRIFDPFFTTKGVGKGTGLGLSLSYGIVKDHGGHLSVTSKVGEGSTFRLQIPVVAGQEPKLGVLREECKSGAVPPSRVLAVDDEPVILVLLRQVLSEGGHTVVAESGVAAALERLKVEKFDAIFTDWRMPGRDGRAFYETLRKEHPEYRGRVVFVTGDSLDTDVHKFAEADANQVVHKPFSKTQIHSVLHQAVTRASTATPELAEARTAE